MPHAALPADRRIPTLQVQRLANPPAAGKGAVVVLFFGVLIVVAVYSVKVTSRFGLPALLLFILGPAGSTGG
jgi:hypothetical protein